MATESELKAIIKKERGGNWIIYYGHQIGTAKVYEIWTSTKPAGVDDSTLPPDHTPQTRFWLEDENGKKLYFAYFADLAAHLNKSKSASLIAPTDLTIGQLISGLKPDQFWQVVTAAAIVVLVCFGLGAWLGLPHFW